MSDDSDTSEDDLGSIPSSCSDSQEMEDIDESFFDKKKLREVIRMNRAAFRFQKFNTLKSLCVANIIAHQEFYINYAEATGKNPMEKLPTKLRQLMLESAWKVSPAILINGEEEHRLFLTMLLYRGIEFLDIPTGIPYETRHMLLQAVVKEGTDSLLRLSFKGSVGCADNFLNYILRLKRLRVLQIPDFECNNQQLESIAVHLPCLRELSTVRLRITESSDFTSSLGALSKLKDLEKFKFSFQSQDASETYNMEFMDQCLQALPSLKHLGNDLNIPVGISRRYISRCSHNLKVFKNQRVRLALEHIVLERNIPKNCCLPNLKCVLLNSSSVKMHNIAKFSSVCELVFWSNSYSNVNFDLLKIMGNQLTTLQMYVPSVCIATIFTSCKQLKNLQLAVSYIEDSEVVWSIDSIRHLETFTFNPDGIDTLIPEMLLHRIAQAPMLKVLKINGGYTNREEMKQLITDVQSQLILQNLVEITFWKLNNEELDEYMTGLIHTLLKYCAAYCPKICKVCIASDFNMLEDSDYEEELTRMNILSFN